MSTRHTRTGYLANDLHNGTCLVPSMGWVGSVMPPGRHRAPPGQVRYYRFIGGRQFRMMRPPWEQK